MNRIAQYPLKPMRPFFAHNPSRAALQLCSNSPLVVVRDPGLIVPDQPPNDPVHKVLHDALVTQASLPRLAADARHLHHSLIDACTEPLPSTGEAALFVDLVISQTAITLIDELR